MARARKPRPPEEGPLARVFGVRHLSPAGAFHLGPFLDAVDPTAVLIEGPSDASDLLAHLVHEATRPPVAVLAYTKKRPVRSILYPLAAYSPEWVAATWGLARGRLVRFIDLPAATFLALREGAPLTGGDEEAAPGPYTEDPYEGVAQRAGEADYETWWERAFEHLTDGDAYREAVLQMARELRDYRTGTPMGTALNVAREAYMRRAIRRVIADGHDPARVVVVCGAFHAPALVGEAPAMTTEEVRALPSVPVAMALTPYSYYRLSAQSGYGAGNHAPGYYQLLWEALRAGRREGVGARYAAAVAGELRRAGSVRSGAAVIEAVRLAEGLAALHGASAPTLRDLRDAAVTCLGAGDPGALSGCLAEVEVGGAIGALPPGVAKTSIQEDFHAQVKDLRLDAYLRDEVPEGRKGGGNLELDLRTNRYVKTEGAAQRARRQSAFLHRVALLDLGFAAKVEDGGARAENTFRERWSLRWSPACELSLVQLALRGETIEGAAVEVFRERLAAARDVAAAAALALAARDCDLPAAMEAATERVAALAVDDASFESVAAGVYELAEVVRRRDVTDLDVRPLEPLVSQLFLRAALLVGAAARCTDAAARDVRDAMGRVQWVASFEDWGATLLPAARWTDALDGLADAPGTNALVAGAACALLLERGALPDGALDGRVARRLSPGADPREVAGFFEGLASRNRHALLRREALWRALSAYVDGLDGRAFRRALPGLRRAFAAFAADETREAAAALGAVWSREAAPAAPAAPRADGGADVGVDVGVDEGELREVARLLADLELLEL